MTAEPGIVPPGRNTHLGRGGSTTTQSATYSAPDEIVHLNKYHLMLVLRRLMDRPKDPSFDHVLIPAGLAVATIAALLSANFQSYAGIDAAVWEAMFFIIAATSSVASIVLLIRWIIHRVKNPPKSEEDIYEEIVLQMEHDRQRLARLQARATASTRASSLGGSSFGGPSSERGLGKGAGRTTRSSLHDAE